MSISDMKVRERPPAAATGSDHAARRHHDSDRAISERPIARLLSLDSPTATRPSSLIAARRLTEA
jgi:hypothetical protein